MKIHILAFLGFLSLGITMMSSCKKVVLELEEMPPPTGILIHSIDLTSISPQKPNGEDWDENGSAPDIVFQLAPEGSFFRSTDTVFNALPETSLTVSNGEGLRWDDPESTFSYRLLDVDLDYPIPFLRSETMAVGTSILYREGQLTSTSRHTIFHGNIRITWNFELLFD